jgi:hypothetical protein
MADQQSLRPMNKSRFSEKSCLLLALMLQVALASSHPQVAFGAPKDCSRAFSFLKFFRNWGPLNVTSPSEIRELAERPAEVILNQSLPQARAEFAEMGYTLDYGWHKKERMRFVRNPDLLSDTETGPMPAHVESQRKKFLERFGNWGSPYLNPSNREKYYSHVPQHDHILTVRTLQKIKPGLYSFVVIEGENFLRLGMGHHLLGARRMASSAGEVVIEADPVTGKHVLTGINARSDTYRPLDKDLLPALEAIWRQGITPEKIKILNWYKELLLELE